MAAAALLDRRMATILIVDDDPGVLRLAAIVLEQGGYQVMRASSGIEALMIYSSYAQRVDLLLTDVDMPGMTGIELAARVSTNRPAVKILLMTGALPGGIELPEPYPVLPKPFRPATLREAVQRALETAA